MKIEIDIDSYLSEEEKKEIAIDAFRQSVMDGLDKNKDDNRKLNDYERVISNSIFYYLSDEIDSMLGCDTKDMIRENVIKTIKSCNFNYSLFRKKTTYESEDSPAQKIAKEAVESHRDEMTKKIHAKLDEAIETLDFDTLYVLFGDIFQDFISERLTSKK